MPLTPADIHNVAFKKPPIGGRGYDEEEVDAFLDELEREIARLTEENLTLRSQLGPGGPGGDDPQERLRAELTALRAQMARALQEKAAAEEAATRLQFELRDARSAPPPAPDGGPTGTRVLMIAQRTADEHLVDARREAESLLLEAQAEAERTTAEASGAAATIDGEARERHRQAIADLERQRADLLDQIEGLTGLATDYRHRLRAVLASQLRDLLPGPADE